MTTRALPEWIGKTPDTAIPDRVRVRVYVRDGGTCQKCGWRLFPGDVWECDHTLSIINGGQNRETNLQVLCEQCHVGKTRQDVAIKSKTYRMAKKHLGIKKSGRPMPGSRRSKFKKRMDGTVEVRK